MPASLCETLLKGQCVKIKFYGKTGEVVTIREAKADNDWDACMEAWSLIKKRTVRGAKDFDLVMED